MSPYSHVFQYRSGDSAKLGCLSECANLEIQHPSVTGTASLKTHHTTATKSLLRKHVAETHVPYA
jgi:hypothetical protein